MEGRGIRDEDEERERRKIQERKEEENKESTGRVQGSAPMMEEEGRWAR